MKKYATVPMRCKFKRAINSLKNSGISYKSDLTFSFRRKKDAEADKTYHVGREHFVSFMDMIRTVAAAAAAVLLSLAVFRILFGIKVSVEAGKKSKK
ncbi:MAG: hypothetical protein MJ137_01500 [Clostridia bacterium]|nr:hypothetical protein [Clostridia bacterium]